MCRIVIKKKAKKIIDALPRNEQLPNGEEIKPKKGHEGLLRLHVGACRIIFTVDHGELIVCVIDAGNRGQIYNWYETGIKKPNCIQNRHP